MITHKQQSQNSCNSVSPRDMVCLGNMCMDTLHKGDDDDDDDDDEWTKYKFFMGRWDPSCYNMHTFHLV